MKLIIKTRLLKPEICIFQTIGELDASNAVLVDKEIIQILKTNPRQVWIDATELTYISSTGLGVFLSHLHTFKSRNINLVFFGLNPKTSNVFNILGLNEIIPIVATLNDAICTFGNSEAKPAVVNE